MKVSWPWLEYFLNFAKLCGKNKIILFHRRWSQNWFYLDKIFQYSYVNNLSKNHIFISQSFDHMSQKLSITDFHLNEKMNFFISLFITQICLFTIEHTLNIVIVCYLHRYHYQRCFIANKNILFFFLSLSQ